VWMYFHEINALKSTFWTGIPLADAVSSKRGADVPI
jgi:hypothetical protein